MKSWDWFSGKDKVESNNDFILMWNSTLVFSDQKHKLFPSIIRMG